MLENLSAGNCIDGCCSVALTVAATDWYIITVITLMWGTFLSGNCVSYRWYCNWLIHLHSDSSYEHPSLCVDIRLLTSRCRYTPRCQARLVHCRGHIVGVHLDQTCFTYKKCLTIMIFRLKCHNLFVMEISSAKVVYQRYRKIITIVVL